jgi:hypothetical protein
VIAVLANPGTAIVFVVLAHLLVLNLLIGVVEGCLLAMIVRIRFIRAVAIMILANYVSAWIGAFLLGWIAPSVYRAWDPDPPLFHVRLAFLLVLALSFVLAVVIELPFVRWAARAEARPRLCRRAVALEPIPKEKLSRRRLLAACTLLQAVSYAGLAAYYAPHLELSLLYFRPVRDASLLAKDARGWVYYISVSSNEIRRVRLDGTGDEPVAPAGLEMPLTLLARDGDVVDLMSDPAGTVRSFAERAHGRIAGSGALTIADFRDRKEIAREVIKLWDYEYPVRLTHVHTESRARASSISAGGPPIRSGTPCTPPSSPTAPSCSS